MIRLDAATFLLQWAVGGLAFLWVTTRRREVGIGYGWLLRGTYALMALASIVVAQIVGPVPVRDAAAVGVVLASGWAFLVSYRRRRAGVSLERERVEARSARVTAMTGIDRETKAFDTSVEEFPPSARPRGSGHRSRRPGGRRHRRGVAGLVVGGADRRRCPVPRGGDRRDAPRPLVPRAAGHGPRAPARAGAVDRLAVAVRGRRAPDPDRHGVRAERHHRRRLRRDPRLDVVDVRGDDDRPGDRDPRRRSRSVSTRP